MARRYEHSAVSVSRSVHLPELHVRHDVAGVVELHMRVRRRKGDCGPQSGLRDQTRRGSAAISRDYGAISADSRGASMARLHLGRPVWTDLQTSSLRGRGAHELYLRLHGICRIGIEETECPLLRVHRIPRRGRLGSRNSPCSGLPGHYSSIRHKKYGQPDTLQACWWSPEHLRVRSQMEGSRGSCPAVWTESG